MTDTEAKALRAAAEKATPGPWQIYEAEITYRADMKGVEYRIGTVADDPQLHAPYPVVTTAHYYDEEAKCGKAIVGLSKDNAEFIEKFNPAVVLELLDMIERLSAPRSLADASHKFNPTPQE